MLKNEEISMECVKNFDGFSILGEKFGPFEKGKKYRMKFFQAIPFIEHNILNINPTDKCDNVDVQRFAIEERDDQRIIIHDNKYLLNKIKEFKRFMEKEVREGIKPQEFLTNFNSYLSNIIDSRLLKLLRLSRSELSLDDERRLTKSEQFLYNKIYELINNWRSFFLTSN